jgi:hypothetical protein
VHFLLAQLSEAETRILEPRPKLLRFYMPGPVIYPYTK